VEFRLGKITEWQALRWQRLYQAALLEFDDTTFRRQVLKAENAIIRQRKLQESSDSHAEKQAIEQVSRSRLSQAGQVVTSLITILRRVN